MYRREGFRKGQKARYVSSTVVCSTTPGIPALLRACHVPGRQSIFLPFRTFLSGQPLRSLEEVPGRLPLRASQARPKISRLRGSRSVFPRYDGPRRCCSAAATTLDGGYLRVSWSVGCLIVAAQGSHHLPLVPTSCCTQAFESSCATWLGLKASLPICAKLRYYRARSINQLELLSLRSSPVLAD